MDIRPKFRSDLTVLDSNEREATGRMILRDKVSGRYFRLSQYELRLLRALDGTITLAEATAKLKSSGYHYAVSDARSIVARASQLGLLLGTGYSTSKHMQDLKGRLKSAGRVRLIANVYYLFLPILDPDRFLTRTVWIFKLIVNRWVAIFAALAAIGAIGLIIMGLPRMNLEYLFFFNWQNLLCLWLAIALTKLVHEFSHAYTAKYFGLRVPEMGVAFLIFFPCLYCNTTDAWQLADRKQRAAIAAAGILAEAALAIVATYVWYFSGPSLINSLAFYQMAVAFVSTVLFNGNPLLKFDGYFILIDTLGLPNLAANALKHIKYLLMNRVMGINKFATPAQNPRQATIYTVYGISAFLYRITLYVGIVVGVYYRFDKVLGVLLAFVALGLFVVRPLWTGARSLYTHREDLKPQNKGLAALAAIVAAVLAVLFVPWSSKSVYPCFVGSEKVQKLTLPLQTLVRRVFVREGSVVRAGEPLFQLDTSLLTLRLRQKEIERRAIWKQIQTVLLDEKLRSKAERLEVELRLREDEIRLLQERLRQAEHSMIAPFDGVITNLDYRVQDGFQPGEGVVVGEMQSSRDLVIHALVPATDLHKISEGEHAEIWLPAGSGVMLKRKIESVKSYSEGDLRNSPFSSRFGGELATEVRGEKQEDVPLEPQYDCSVRVVNHDGSIMLGMTGRLTVSAPRISLAGRFFQDVLKAFHRESLL